MVKKEAKLTNDTLLKNTKDGGYTEGVVKKLIGDSPTKGDVTSKILSKKKGK
jgi:hypothetical protein